MHIVLNIPNSRIAQLFSSAIEGGDPVTGGWCNGINPHGGSRRKAAEFRHWYTAEKFFSNGFLLQVSEVLDDGRDGKVKVHTINDGHVRRGLTVMARVFPSQFEQILSDNIDAPCADAFLQSVLFGEEKYA